MTKLNTTNDSDIYLWNADTKALTHLTPHTGEAQYSPATFDPASRYLYYLSNEGSEFTRLRRYSLAAGTHEDVEKADWDIVSFGFSEKGTYRLTGGGVPEIQIGVVGRVGLDQRDPLAVA